MIQLSAETIISFNDAANRLPRRRRGRKTVISTIYRWATTGIRGVQLETIQIGGSRCTSVEALQRFFDSLSEHETDPSTQPQRSGNQRIEDELDRAGI